MISKHMKITTIIMYIASPVKKHSNKDGPRIISSYITAYNVISIVIILFVIPPYLLHYISVNKSEGTTFT